MKTAKELQNLLSLKRLSSNVYLGKNAPVGSPNVFGGQVFAQALYAAQQTIHTRRILHSAHAYFLEPGSLKDSILYSVDDIRDGGSFSTRRVLAAQENKTIFILAASFHKLQKGYNHQVEISTDIASPDKLPSWDDYLDKYKSAIPKRVKTFLETERPVEFKPLKPFNPYQSKNEPPYSKIWFRLKKGKSISKLALKQQILAYISDFNILATALLPHASKANFGNTQMASLDHSMWFFRDFDFRDWLLFDLESPSASNARAYARGNIYTREGVLVASVAQEGLMRPF